MSRLALGFSRSVSRLSDLRGAASSLGGKRQQIFGFPNRRTRWADPPQFASALPSFAAVENPRRRPAVRAQPPAGLQPGLPAFSWKMDGFTGSLGECETPPTHSRPPKHVDAQRWDAPSCTRIWRLYTCHCCIYQRLCTAPPVAARKQNQHLLLETLNGLNTKILKQNQTETSNTGLGRRGQLKGQVEDHTENPA